MCLHYILSLVHSAVWENMEHLLGRSGSVVLLVLLLHCMHIELCTVRWANFERSYNFEWYSICSYNGVKH